ncbi:MAG: CpaF family protein [Actinobacteria bacterium]|nr:CpaF family protein [Actinomycetota bacterium]
MSLAERLDRRSRATESSATSPSIVAERPRVDSSQVVRLADAVRSRLAELPDRASMTDERLRSTVEGEVAALLADEPLASEGAVPTWLRSAVLDELLGFGVLQDLLDDSSVSEIMVNGLRGIWVESNGVLHRTTRSFSSLEQLLRVIDRMVHSAGRRVDQASPMVDARLPDGSRLNVILPPLSVDGPSVTIRKFTSAGLTMDDLVRQGSLDSEAADFLESAVRNRMNVLVSGGTGTGKTTMLNVLSSFIGRDERVVTVEDAVELTLDLPNLVRLEARPANTEGSGEVTIRDLVRNSLRMRPNRIVVGEVRGWETIDMLQAMNTGHEGSLSTVHANTPRDALRRLETMTLLGGVDLPLRAIREQIASSIDLIVHLARDARGRRFVSEIAEVEGMESDVVAMADLFVRSRSNGEPSPLKRTAVSSRRMAQRKGDS